jgi:hypothetical protein
MKTKGNFLSYIASEKKQRKQEVKSPANASSQNEYGRSKHNNSMMADYSNEMANYQIS